MSTITELSGIINLVLLTIVILLGVIVVLIMVRVVDLDIPTISAGTQPNNLGVSEQRLTACPTSPNCISSQSKALTLDITSSLLFVSVAYRQRASSLKR